MRDFKGKRALVTGAASGIGRATAIALAREGADLVICDVDENGMGETSASIHALAAPKGSASGMRRRVLAKKVDVSSREQMRALADEVHREGPLDVLVNNAGVGLGGSFLDTSLDDWEWILGINLRGVVHGCHFFVPKMVESKNGGHVVNISSAAGYTPSPTLAAYCTTKYGVLGLSECLRIELAAHRIGVTAICPGIINTPITRNSRMVGRAARAGAQEKVVRFYEKRNYGPEKVADEIVRAIRHNRAIVPVSPEAWAFYLVKRASPTLFHKLSAVMTKRMDAMIDE
jgi:NAD(P)-dependent dehydrogenase (short-subunit alcohol dehydrogenase family)